MKKIKVTKEWAVGHRACRTSVKRFFRRFPAGLTLTRQNLYMASRELPVGDIRWFGRAILEPWMSQAGLKRWLRVKWLAETDNGYLVRSSVKKLIFAEALADELGLS